MNLKQLNEEIEAVVRKAFKEGVSRKSLTPQQVADALIVHGEYLRQCIAALKANIDSAESAKKILDVKIPTPIITDTRN